MNVLSIINFIAFNKFKSLFLDFLRFNFCKNFSYYVICLLASFFLFANGEILAADCESSYQECINIPHNNQADCEAQMQTCLEERAAEDSSSAGTSSTMPSSQDVFKKGSEGLFSEKANIIKDYTPEKVATGEALFRNLVEQMIGYLKKLLTPISILLLSWSGAYLFLSRTNEEEFKKRRNEVFGMVAGFTIILLSVSLVDNVFFGAEGELFREDGEANIKKFAGSGLMELKGLFSFATSFVIAIAVIFLIFETYSLMIGGENEEQMEKAKKRITFSIVGIAVIISIQELVDGFTDSSGKLTLPDAFTILGVGGYWSNRILGFIGVISVSALVWAGVQMIINFGDEERVESAKKIFKFVIIGLVVTFSMWTIIRYFLTAGAPYSLT